MAAVDALRTRRSFARLNKTVDVPNLIDIQRRSFAWLTDPEKGGLRETIDDMNRALVEGCPEFQLAVRPGETGRAAGHARSGRPKL